LCANENYKTSEDQYKINDEVKPLIIEVWDANKIKDVLLGRIVYNLDNANEYLYRIDYEKLKNPNWHDVISKRNQKCGQLLFSVCVLPENNIEQGSTIFSI